MGIQTQMALQPALVRDKEYYIEDGNTVIQVENVLFKVHRYILSRDGSAFEGMFSLDGIPRSGSSESLASGHSHSPHYSHHSPSTEGLSDDSPIILSGDTASDFRALLWALYALPAQVFAMPSSSAQLVRLISIARIAHKYAFRTTEAWALTVLTMCVCQSGTQAPATPEGTAVTESMGFTLGFTDSSDPKASSTSILIQLTEVAVLCAHDELHEAVEPIWADLLFAGQTKDIVSAMTIADRYKAQLRPLLGLAYYLMMLKGKEEWTKCAVGYDDGDDEMDHGEGKTKGENSNHRLTRDQRIRLLTGYYNLSRACDALPSSPPKLAHHPSCFLPAQQAQASIGLGGAGTAAHAHARCGEAWEALWATLAMSTVANLRPVDAPMQIPIIKIQSVDLLRKLHMVNYVLETLVSAEVDGAATVAGNTALGGLGAVGMSYMSMTGNMNKNCLRMALKASEEKVNDVLYGLADCFLE